MNKRFGYVLAFLLVAALACKLPISAVSPTTQASPKITNQPEATSIQVKPSSTFQEATATQKTVIESSPTIPPTTEPTATQAPAASKPVVLGNLKSDPAKLSVVDPLTGKVQRSFDAAGLMQDAPAYVAADALFYLDSGYKKVRWAGFDGSSGVLTFINPTTDIFKGVILPSPDGKKVAWAIIAGESADSTQNQLMIANKDGSGKLTLVDETSTPPASWAPMGWSPDGEWLYFASTPYGIGGYILFNGVTSVRRVPVKGGTAEDILPNQITMGDAALSPDGKTVAFIHTVYGQNPSDVTLNLELQVVASQKVKSFPLPAGYLQAGAIVWSPDSQSLVLSLAVGNADSEAFTLIQVDAKTLAVQTLFTKDNRLLRAITWPVAGMLWLKDTDGNAWRMDMASGKLTQAGTDLTVLSNDYR